MIGREAGVRQGTLICTKHYVLPGISFSNTNADMDGGMTTAVMRRC